MIDLEIAKKAIQSLQEEFGTLPTTGFLAGGAIANRMFQLKYGYLIPVNDIDIFHFDKELLDIEYAHRNHYIVEDKKCFHAKTQDDVGEDGYGNFFIQTKTTQGYIVKDNNRDGIYNNIYLKASHLDPNLILKSFDLNCTQVGYDLETQEFFYTKEWLDFYQNKEIKVCSLHTPAHTILRLFKKCEEFKTNLSKEELNILKYALHSGSNFQRRCFTEKYKRLADKYQQQLEENSITLVEDPLTSDFLKNKTGKDINIWTLKNINVMNKHGFMNSGLSDYFPDIKISWNTFFGNLDKFLWAYRNIHPNPDLITLWDNLHHLYEVDGFKDLMGKFSQNQLLFYGKLYEYAPILQKKIEGDKLWEHFNYIDKLFTQFDPNVALAICMKKDTPTIWDESDELLLELSVRIKSQRDDILKKSEELKVLWNNI